MRQSSKKRVYEINGLRNIGARPLVLKEVDYMEIRKLANEMVDTLREGVWNNIDQEVTNERWNNIGYAAQAMVELELAEQQILKMLIKYWDLRPSEAKDVLQFAMDTTVDATK